MSRVVLVLAVSIGCSTETPEVPGGTPDPFAVEVVEFLPGENAGFGQEKMPDVVLGPPEGGYSSQGSVDVVSLGTAGSITLRMGSEIVDVDGADFIVFENPFEFSGGAVFAEAGEVSVSADGETFITFPCAPEEEPPNGCAGYNIVLAGADNDLDPTDPDVAGGDAFDLASIGVASAMFVKIVDRAGPGAAPSAGFDLDAVAVVSR